MRRKSPKPDKKPIIAPLIGYELGPVNCRPIDPDIFRVDDESWDLLRTILDRHNADGFSFGPEGIELHKKISPTQVIPE